MVSKHVQYANHSIHCHSSLITNGRYSVVCLNATKQQELQVGIKGLRLTVSRHMDDVENIKTMQEREN